jgi:predicted dehydrogenase
MDRLGVAVIGVGRWGVNLLRALGEFDNCRVVCVHDGSEQRAAEAAAALPGVDIAQSYDELLADSRVHAVLLATPPETHGPMARQALEAGRHVFVEKPMATSLADALSLERTAHRNKCLVMAGHLLKFHGGVTALRQIVAQGQLGHIEFALSRRIGWRNSDRCGPWWSLAPHDLSVLRGALGAEPEQIAAAACLPVQSARSAVRKVLGGSQPPPSIRCPQRVLAAASFPAATATTSTLIDVGLLDESKMRRVILIGRRAMARFEDGPEGGIWIRPSRQGLDLSPLPLADGNLSPDMAIHFLETVEAATRGDGWNRVLAEWPDALRTELRQFIAACQNPKLARTEMDDALSIMRALEAGARSMREGGRTMNVPKAARPVPGEMDGLQGSV